MGQRLIHVSREMIKQLLQLPDDMNIVHVFDDPKYLEGDITLKVESSIWPEVKPGSIIPYELPVYTASIKDCGCREVKLTAWYGIPVETKNNATTTTESPGASADESDQPIVKKLGREFI